MRKLFMFAVAAFVMLATSCAKDDVSDPQVGGDQLVSFSVSTPELATRAISDGETAKNLTVTVYEKDANGQYDLLEDLTQTATFVDLKAKVNFRLVNGKTYCFAFWAQAEGAPYTFDPESATVKVDYTGDANDEKRDAFFTSRHNLTINGAISENITLKRPFAQLNVATADWAEALKSEIEVTETDLAVKENIYTTLNLLSGEVSDEITTPIYLDLSTIPAGADVNAEAVEKLKGHETYRWLSMNYLLVNEKELTQVEMLTNDSDVALKSWSNVPLQRNYRTNILGNILTSNVDFNVVINPIYETPDYNLNVWDGSSISEPAYDDATRTYTVMTAAELAWIAAAADGELETRAATIPSTNFKNVTILLGDNIYLGGHPWAWNKLWYPEGKPSFDGAGYTVYGLTAPLIASATVNVKNLVVDGADIYTTKSFASAVVGNLYGDINNVVVKNTTITADTATKIIRCGGIVGIHNSGNATNCRVENVTIADVYHNAGGISGTVNETNNRTYTNCVAIDCNISIRCTEGVGATYVGAISGNANGVALTLEACYAEGTTPEVLVGGGNVTAKVAELNGTYYATINEAAAAAVDGDTINLAAGEHELAELKGKDVRFVGTNEASVLKMTGGIAHNNTNFEGASLSFENLTIEGATYDGKHNGYVQSAREYYKNCTFKNYYMFAGDEVVVDDCNFVCEVSQYFWTGSAEVVTFNRCKFNTYDRAIKVCSVGNNMTAARVVNINECEFSATTLKKAVLEIDSVASPYEVNVDNSTKNDMFDGWFNCEGANAIVVNVDGNKAYPVAEVNGVSYGTIAEAITAVGSGATITLVKGTHIVPDEAKGKTLTFVGTGAPEDTVIATQDDGSYEGCDYSLDGSTVTFENISINTDSHTYTGYARCNGTYKNCIINGTYTLYGNSVFEDCTLNVSGDVYNIWTWGAPTATFTRCAFNSDGKAMLLYGTENTKLTMNDCTFNDNGGLPDLKAAIEIGNDYGKSYELIVNNATVNGYEINDKGINTGTTLWANKNSMGQDKLNVVVDGVDVY